MVTYPDNLQVLVLFYHLLLLLLTNLVPLIPPLRVTREKRKGKEKEKGRNKIMIILLTKFSLSNNIPL